MKDLELKKIDEELLEEVTGGSKKQTNDLIQALKDNGVIDRRAKMSKNDLVDLLDRNNIEAEIYYNNKCNSYIRYDGRKLSQNDLLEMIARGMIK